VAQTPADVGTVSLDGAAREIAGGLAHTCAMLETGDVQCWGFGAYGQLGYGDGDSIGDNELPSDAGVVPLGVSVRSIAADGNHTCAITETGSVRCWGQGADGRLGYGNTDNLGDDEALDTVPDVPLFATADE
jgi:alpha-tubulin suppressor-like RCC1 family protein